MPLTRPAPDETREMRLFSKLLVHRCDETLPQFIAKRRAPGAAYSSWEELVFALGEATGELVSDVSLRKWAKRYGIPEDTRADDSPEPFLSHLDQLGIKV